MDRLYAALRPDAFTLMILAAVGLASVLPATGGADALLSDAVRFSVMALFFLHGARLAPEAVRQALGHWRLQSLVLALTFGVFPLLGLLLGLAAGRVLEPTLWLGVLFLCCLPSTVQTSIAFTAVARGNVAAAACAASFSNLLGIVVTPLLAGWLLARQGAMPAGAVGSIVTLLLLPFVAGQVARPWLGAWVSRHRPLLLVVDRGAILLMIYSAFGRAVADGVWGRVSATDLALVLLVSVVLLAAIVAVARFASRRGRFAREDEAAILFCGSMKSLVTGMPMANVLFPAPQAAVLVIPLIVYHQVQLLACAVLARRMAQERPAPESHVP